jgi:N-carbamoylputrescine amidase
MKITVCELPNEPSSFSDAWSSLVQHVGDNQSDLVLLPEMPFYRWLAQSQDVDPVEWQRAVEAHDEWISRFGELHPAAVVSSRPVVSDGRRQNMGFCWQPNTGTVDVHAKRYLPDELGFWEASWYERGPGDFSLARVAGAKLGFLICSELWFFRHARDYGQNGAHIIACPRATPTTKLSKWMAGGTAAAVVAGAFCLSSNLSGTTSEGGDFAGVGWIAEPDQGTLLGTTSANRPFLTVDVDLADAEQAKSTYPRYVEE